MRIVKNFNVLRELPSTLAKEVLIKEYVKDTLFVACVRFTYDKVLFTYNVGERTLEEVFTYTAVRDLPTSTLRVVQNLKTLVELNLRGDRLKTRLLEMFRNLNREEAELFRMILRRDLRIGVNIKTLNKYLSKEDRITKPVYCRCGIFSDKTKKSVNYPAYLQVKEDGMYIEATIGDEPILLTRQGESKNIPTLKTELQKLSTLLNGYKLIGEVRVLNTYNTRTVLVNNGLSTKKVDSIKGQYLPRTLGNGLLNSDYPPKDIKYIVWDLISPELYNYALDRVKSAVGYKERFNAIVANIDGDTITFARTRRVNSEEEVIKITREWIRQGEEGAILKDYTMEFKDGTSNQQLKIKPIFTVDVEITGFIEGKKGTKRENTFGSLTFKSADDKLQGSTSGFTDEELEMFNKDRERWIGKIIEVESTAVTKAKNKDIYALQHPRFIEVRYDKSEADTLERILESEKTFRIL